MCSSKKGISAHQLHRILEITYKSAWFMAHRIREAMRTGELAPMGGAGSITEADETFIGNKKGAEKRRGYSHKMAVLALVERGGDVRSFQIDKARTKDIQPVVNANLDRESMLMTDEATYYRPIGKAYKHHFTVDHGSGEYVRGSVHTNTLEGYFSIFKRGIKGVYQHVSEKHLHRYLAEFDFRYNNRIAVGVDDQARALKALRGIAAKRLKYEGPNKEIAV
jgi:transposase-like protein